MLFYGRGINTALQNRLSSSSSSALKTDMGGHASLDVMWVSTECINSCADIFLHHDERLGIFSYCFCQ